MTKHIPRNRRMLLLLATVWAALAGPMVFAQVSAAPSEPAAQSVPVMPKYNVATVKPNVSGSGVTIQDAKPEIVRLENTSVFWMLRMVYGLAEEQIIGAPNWIKSSHYDVVAKMADEDVPMLRQIPMMQRFRVLQPLLEERFGLKYHYETRQLYAYTITVAKGGPKLKAIEPIFDEKTGNLSNGSFSGNPGNYRAEAMTMDRLASALSNQLSHTVVDKTGLTGHYTFTLQWSRNQEPSGEDVNSPYLGPSIFTAMQEQLGLKLSEGKVPLQVMVIDHIEMPSEN